MTTIEYFKLQAKNLHKDFKTQQSYFDPTYGRDFYKYVPKFFDVEALALDFDIDEDHFTLMNAQHIIAKLGGFGKWTEMLKASPAALELSKLLFGNMQKVSVVEWDIYISVEEDNKGFQFDDEFKLDIFKMVFADVDGHQSDGYDYRLGKHDKPSNEDQIIKPKKKKSGVKISVLPLARADRLKLIKAANQSFERIMDRIEPDNPQLTRSLWDAERFIDEEILKPNMLPIDRDHAFSLVDAFLVGYVIQLAAKADELGRSSSK